MTINLRNIDDSIFGRYGALSKFEYIENIIPLSTYNASHQIYSGSQVNCEIRFPSYSTFRQFLEEMQVVQDYIDDKRIRDLNPTVARAYAEYQLLLKLSK